jgi:hypothetical protein
MVFSLPRRSATVQTPTQECENLLHHRQRLRAQASVAESSVALPPVREMHMPIRVHLNGQKFDPETIRVMGLAYELALVALERTDWAATPTREAVAQKIIHLAKAGERDPERLCDGALKATQPTAPAWISDPSPLPPPASPPEPPDS